MYYTKTCEQAVPCGQGEKGCGCLSSPNCIPSLNGLVCLGCWKYCSYNPNREEG